MTKISICGVSLIGLAILTTGGCSMQDKKTEARIKGMSVECETADGDLRMLDEEKKSTAQRIGSGVRSVVPIGLVAGVVTGTAGTKYRIATGKYNQMIDDKIAEIKQACPGAAADE
ncbi:MAG TPA: hypothetical protein VNY80_12505 [Steroidobacteraceae bacterium]|jgi:hypothetical protein|nr:hypothetical protein [Steroidobacteraceae bacterium]